MEKISKHISHLEATKSITANRCGITNEPNESQLENMKVIADKVFEPLRKALGNKSIRIASFFRSKALNEIIGGATRSQHVSLRGSAIDLDNDGHKPTNRAIFDYIKDNLEFDQLILEHPDKDFNPSWVHVSYNEGKNRNQILICRREYPKYITYEENTSESV